jgi:hypothetical protein
MSQAVLPRLPNALRPIRKGRRSRSTRLLNTRAAAENLLRELAFVLAATRRVKEAMAGERPPA